MPFCVVVTDKYSFDLGQMPQAMLEQVLAEYKIQASGGIFAIREMLLGSTYAEIDQLYERLAAVAAQHDYPGIRLIPTS
jgi:hypothetical protein